MNQTCRVCGEEKSVFEFSFRSDSGKHRTDCKLCASERVKKCYSPEQKKKYDSRPDILEKQKSWRQGYYDRPEVKAAMEEYWLKEENKDRKRQWTKEYQAREGVKARKRVSSHMRRKYYSSGRMPLNGWDMLQLFYGKKCMNPECGSDKRLSLDHVVPLSKGGQHELNNSQVLCLSCNISKGTKTVDYRCGVILESLELK